MPHGQRKQNKQVQPLKPKQDLGFLRFKADGSQVTIQHHDAASAGDGNGALRSAAVPTLRIDLRASKIWVGTAAPLPADSPLTLGIIGLLRLERGCILALVSKAKRVCGLLDGPVYKVEDTTLVAPEGINGCDNDLRYASLLQEALNPQNFGSHMYFSHSANITSSRQRQADTDPGVPPLSGPWPTPSAAGGRSGAERPGWLGPWWLGGAAGGGGGDGGGGGEGEGEGPHGEPAQGGAPGGAGRPAGVRRGGGVRSLWSRADPRFVWNAQLMKPLIDAGAEAFALPIMVGYLGQAAGASFTLRAPPRPGPSQTGPASEVGEASNGRPAEAAGGVAGGGCEASCPGEVTVITRVAVERPVAGGWRRGADRQGNTAGFAETEVLVSIWQPEQQQQQPWQQEGGTSGDQAPDAGGEEGVVRLRTRVAVASYVMARGSAPLYWAAPPDLMPCPAPRGPEEPDTHSGPFRKHVEALIRAYGRPVLLLNLLHGANQRAQLRLHDALQRQAAEFAAAAKPQDPPATPAAPAPSTSSAPASAAAAAGASGKDSSAPSDPTAPHPPAGGGGSGSARAVTVVGLPLRNRDLADLASCGEAAARLERACAPECCRIRPFVSLEELEVVRHLPGPAGGGGGSGGGGGRGRHVSCVGRHLACRQEGVVRVSSASAASAGGCCGEVDAAQHALALPPVAEALVTLGALDDPADLERVHTSVVQALAQLFGHQAEVLSDQVLGTGSAAGKALQAAAAQLEHGGWGLAGLEERLVRGPWRRAVVIGEFVSRWYYSNFTDARRQDALDLAAGAFQVGQPPAFMPRRQPPSTFNIQMGVLLILAAIAKLISGVVWPPAVSQDLLTLLTSPALMAAVGLFLLLELLRRGAAFVERPLLRPDEVFPWSS